MRYKNLYEELQNIKINNSKYDEYCRDYIYDLYEASARKRKEEVNENDANLSIQKLIDETMQNSYKLINFLNENIQSLDNWNKTLLTIEALFNRGTEFSISHGAESFSVKFGTSVMRPDFTVFYDPENNKYIFDDILEAGDLDFFRDKNIEEDYFFLVQKLQNPSNGEKIITLYTARPKKDREVYSTNQIPSNIFLTTDHNEAFGYSMDDSRGRDVYKIKIKQKYLIKTLDTPSKKNYQTIGKGFVPIESIQLLTENELSEKIMELDEILEKFPGLKKTKDIKKVGEWLNLEPNEISYELVYEPISKYKKHIKLLMKGYEYYDSDKQRVKKIFDLIKKKAPVYPLFIERNDPKDFILVGRHRIVATYLSKIKEIPIIRVCYKRSKLFGSAE